MRQFSRIKNWQKGKKFKAYLDRCRFYRELGCVSIRGYEFSGLNSGEIGRIIQCRVIASKEQK